MKQCIPDSSLVTEAWEIKTSKLASLLNISSNCSLALFCFTSTRVHCTYWKQVRGCRRCGKTAFTLRAEKAVYVPRARVCIVKVNAPASYIQLRRLVLLLLFHVNQQFSFYAPLFPHLLKKMTDILHSRAPPHSMRELSPPYTHTYTSIMKQFNDLRWPCHWTWCETIGERS